MLSSRLAPLRLNLARASTLRVAHASGGQLVLSWFRAFARVFLLPPEGGGAPDRRKSCIGPLLQRRPPADHSAGAPSRRSTAAICYAITVLLPSDPTPWTSRDP